MNQKNVKIKLLAENWLWCCFVATAEKEKWVIDWQTDRKTTGIWRKMIDSSGRFGRFSPPPLSGKRLCRFFDWVISYTIIIYCHGHFSTLDFVLFYLCFDFSTWPAFIPLAMDASHWRHLNAQPFGSESHHWSANGNWSDRSVSDWKGRETAKE